MSEDADRPFAYPALGQSPLLHQKVPRCAIQHRADGRSDGCPAVLLLGTRLVAPRLSRSLGRFFRLTRGACPRCHGTDLGAVRLAAGIASARVFLRRQRLLGSSRRLFSQGDGSQNFGLRRRRRDKEGDGCRGGFLGLGHEGSLLLQRWAARHPLAFSERWMPKRPRRRPRPSEIRVAPSRLRVFGRWVFEGPGFHPVS